MTSVYFLINNQFLPLFFSRCKYHFYPEVLLSIWVRWLYSSPIPLCTFPYHRTAMLGLICLSYSAAGTMYFFKLIFISRAQQTLNLYICQTNKWMDQSSHNQYKNYRFFSLNLMTFMSLIVHSLTYLFNNYKLSIYVSTLKLELNNQHVWFKKTYLDMNEWMN